MNQNQKIELIKGEIITLVNRTRLADKRRIEEFSMFLTKLNIEYPKSKPAGFGDSIVLTIQSCKKFQSNEDEQKIVNFCIHYAHENLLMGK